VSSSWRKEANALVLDLTIPVNSEAKVSLPLLGLKKPIVKENGKLIYKDDSFTSGVSGIISAKRDKDYITFDIGSGVYSFWIGECA
jgi:alpha-L-rhamnosidase